MTAARLDRRRLLSLVAVGASAPAVSRAGEAAYAGPARFDHGVASGDPLQDRIVLWTRVTPEAGAAGVPVTWELAEDADFRHVVKRGTVQAGPQRDHTVKVDVTGLRPGREYRYRFRCGATVSPVGRARTLPRGRTGKATLAVVSCSLYPNGYFNAYDHIARAEPVDAVVHLGDYLYEYGAEPDAYGMVQGQALGRIPEPPHEMVTLADYRTRHALYKRDPDLQAAHAAAPWICVWDDHEVANDTWVMGAENHQPATEGPFDARKAAAMQAYYEWMPIREPQPGRPFEAINRAFQFGDLASLIMVETRLVARSQQLSYTGGDIPMAVYDATDPASRKRVSDPATVAQAMAAAKAGGQPPAPYKLGPDLEALKAKLWDPSRRMLGDAQEAWVARELADSVAAGRTWQVLGNQVVMGRVQGPNPWRLFPAQAVEAMIAGAAPAERAMVARLADFFAYDIPSNLDAWDGYPAARERLYDAIKKSQGNVVVLAGDSHAFWVNELHDAQGAVRVAAEFGTTSVTSPSNGDSVPAIDLGKLYADQNPEVLLNDQRSKGYIRLTLTPEAAVGELIAVEIDRKPYAARTVATYRVRPAPGPGVEALERV